MKTSRAVIIQCRLSSTRLPGKALKDLRGQPVFAWVLKSMKKVPADRYFVAVDYDSYPVLKPLCDEYGFEIFAGDLQNVLKRYCDLIKTLDCKTIIRATADNPFLFYEAAEESCKDFEERNKGKLHCDYLTWTGLPHGSGVEIFSAESLLKAAEQTDDPYDTEHVGPSLYKHTDKFKCEFIKAPRRFNHPELRTTIDTHSDYLRALNIAEAALKDKDKKIIEPFTTEQIIQACNSLTVKNPVVLVPSVKKGQGTGHLHRCLDSAIGKNFFVYIPENKTLEETDSLLEAYYQKGLKKIQIISQLPDESYLPYIFTDCFELSDRDYEELKNHKALICIDEGGKFASDSDYVLDIIPSTKLNRPSNLSDAAFIKKPFNIRTTPVDKNHIFKILICLGGEDPSNLTIPACQTISKVFPSGEITAVIKNMDNPLRDELKTVDFVQNIPDLKEKLFEYDLVLTHYGLTAFEAAAAGCGVILLPTSNLHIELAKEYKFAYISDPKVSVQALLSALSSEYLIPSINNKEDTKNLGDFIETISKGQKLLCPVCDKLPLVCDELISRNPTRTYRRCRNCSMVYMSWTVDEDKKYAKSYFFDDYKKQYGKTYQEDFENIKAQCKRRISEIKLLSTGVKDKNSLDIGCAFGPFLSAASDAGLIPFGTDISEEAVYYVQKELHFPAACSAFPKIDVGEEFGVEQFDVVTMWYVIEHFKHLDEVLRKVSEITKKGGIFAFSTPSGEGISASSNKDNFYQISPTDHYTIWEPSKAKKILRKYGFEVVKVVSTGHHPERFPYVKKHDIQKGSSRWKFIEQLSHLRKLGDTCEIYCKKI